jgi:hypothetical protein
MQPVSATCYHSVQNLLSSRLLSKSLKIRKYKTIILPVVLYGCETWSLTLREEHRLRVHMETSSVSAEPQTRVLPNTRLYSLPPTSHSPPRHTPHDRPHLPPVCCIVGCMIDGVNWNTCSAHTHTASSSSVVTQGPSPSSESSFCVLSTHTHLPAAQWSDRGRLLAAALHPQTNR